MIVLTRLNGHAVAINPDLVAWVEVTPDTTVSFIGGDKIVVREDLDTLIRRVVEFRRSIHRGPGTVTDITARLRGGKPKDNGIIDEKPRALPRPSWSKPPTSSKPPPGGK